VFNIFKCLQGIHACLVVQWDVRSLGLIIVKYIRCTFWIFLKVSRGIFCLESDLEACYDIRTEKTATGTLIYVADISRFKNWIYVLWKKLLFSKLKLSTAYILVCNARCDEINHKKHELNKSQKERENSTNLAFFFLFSYKLNINNQNTRISDHISAVYLFIKYCACASDFFFCVFVVL
jgi:hypothetical protein